MLVNAAKICICLLLTKEVDNNFKKTSLKKRFGLLSPHGAGADFHKSGFVRYSLCLCLSPHIRVLFHAIFHVACKRFLLALARDALCVMD